MRLLISAGGTGGGVYPALAVLQSLASGFERNLSDLAKDTSEINSIRSELQVLWIGVEGGMEKELISRAGIPFEAIPAAGVHGVGWRKLPGNLRLLARGYSESKKIIAQFKPDVLFFTGGFVAVPMALAGRGVPSLLFVPDIEPGLALKTLAYFTSHVAVTVKASLAYLPRRSHVSVTGYPTREDLKKWNLSEARRLFNLQEDLPTLLVFGGSKGARSINCALFSVLPELLAEMQVIHITGQLDWDETEEIRADLSARTAQSSWPSRYHAFPYLHDEMGAALTIADLVLSRAGASTLGEFPLFELPAILVPYPHAWRYQSTNAQFLVERNAAVMIPDKDLPERIKVVVIDLMRDTKKREGMRQAMHNLAQPSAANNIASLLLQLAGVSKPGGEYLQ